jgi:hypothetical protein
MASRSGTPAFLGPWALYAYEAFVFGLQAFTKVHSGWSVSGLFHIVTSYTGRLCALPAILCDSNRAFEEMEACFPSMFLRAWSS